MTNLEIFEKVQAVIADITDIDKAEITEEASMIDDLDLSSLEIMRSVYELEAAFSVRVPEKDLRRFVLVRDLVDYFAENTV